MEYIQGIADQTEIFLYALGFGFLLGILYDVFRTLRMIISNSKGFVIFMDLLYFAACAFLTFCFVLALDSGRIRAYVAFGEILGWVIYYFSFGAIAMKVSNASVCILRRAVNAVFSPVKRFAGKIFKKTEKFAVICKKNIKKTDKKAKFNLQKYKVIVYNLIGYTGRGLFKRKGKD